MRGMFGARRRAPESPDIDVHQRLQLFQSTLRTELGDVSSQLPANAATLVRIGAMDERERISELLQRKAELERQVPFCDEFVARLLALQKRCRAVRSELDSGSLVTASRELHSITAHTDELVEAVGDVVESTPALHDYMMAQLRRLGHRIHALLLRASASAGGAAALDASSAEAEAAAEAAATTGWGEAGPSWLGTASPSPRSPTSPSALGRQVSFGAASSVGESARGVRGLEQLPRSRPSSPARSAARSAGGGASEAGDLALDSPTGAGLRARGLPSGEQSQLRHAQLIEAAARRWASRTDVTLRQSAPPESVLFPGRAAGPASHSTRGCRPRSPRSPPAPQGSLSPPRYDADPSPHGRAASRARPSLQSPAPPPAVTITAHSDTASSVAEGSTPRSPRPRSPGLRPARPAAREAAAARPPVREATAARPPIDRDYERTGAGSSARRARLRSKRASEARRLQQQRARGGEGGAAAAASGGSSAETAPGPRARFGEWWQSVTPF